MGYFTDENGKEFFQIADKQNDIHSNMDIQKDIQKEILYILYKDGRLGQYNNYLK